MTANVFEDDILEEREAGMSDHVAKPIDPELLFNTLASAFSMYHRTDSKK